MPTTNSPKGSAIPVRPTPQMRQQLDELSAAGFGNQTDVIRIAIDRMYQQEKRAMNAKPIVYVEPEMLGSEAFIDSARRMVELLKERGYDARLGSALHGEDVPESVWNECLDIISREAYADVDPT